ncbi:MAG: SurA N-terminal domain-containing protein [Desulfobacterales bacterium]|uniref:Periplasmic chaperone PpiD n=1 Tax=Candidatus Desulfaltia bathyphila TaxID=2841697 RepID=A0A8J6TC43_9BACT|nr:SurA N-terminal domain-containing protein [Candidatus Desulfaltia bathyphila]MBL7207968.1 SurA N-terminal domain-containing protein [Desulfobacterales bacterium]
MLRLMRDYASSWLIKVILGAIVIVFVFWGVGSFRAQRGGRVALVNGESITMEEYKDEYNNLIEQFRQRFGNRLDDEMIQMFQIKNQALNRLIDQKLLLQEAVKLNFRVSDDELAAAIREIKAFQTSGVFDKRLYRSILNRYGLTPEQFEVNQKGFMLIEKLRSFLLGNLKVSDREAMEWFKWGNASVNIDYILFEPGRYKDINPSAEEIKTFFVDHKESYKTEPTIKVRFLHFDPDNYRAKVNISDKRIHDYYEAHQEEFKTDKTVEARHILIKVDKDAGQEAVEKAKNRALDILQMAREDKDFTELARQYSECPSKGQGGHIGVFRKEAMVKPFADKAFSMKAGEISRLVRTMFGWHIIKVEKINEGSIVSIDEAKKRIRKKLIDEEAKILAYEQAESVFDTIFEGDDLVKASNERNLKLQTTDFFTIKGPDKGIKNREKFASAAFNLSAMEISDIQDLGDGYYILQAIEKTPGEVPELKDVQEKVIAALIKEKQDEKASTDANEFLSGLKKGKLMSAQCVKYGLQLSSAGFFKRNEPVPDIGLEREIVEAAFKLSNKIKLPENVIKGEKGYYVISFNERKEADPEGFVKEKASIKEGLLRQKRIKTFDEWLTQIRNKSKISIEKDFLKQS